MDTLRCITAVLGAVSVSCAVAHARGDGDGDLVAYTEQWPPYNYEEHGKVRGVATDVLRAACTQAQLRCSFRVVPWARALKVVRSTPNTVLYTTARRPDRENQFVWVGPLLPRTTWVYTRSDSGSAPKNADELSQLRIGVVREEAAQQDLLAAGVPTQSLVEASDNDAVFRMLMTDMVHAMVDTEIGMAWNLRMTGRPMNTVSKLRKLSDSGDYYFALNLQSNPVVVRKLQQAIDKLRSEARIDAIVRTYQPAP
jgi:polar amino acid transport system substrate-binding protein